LTGVNLYENLRNLSAMLCAYIKILLMAALIYLHTSMKNTTANNNTHYCIHSRSFPKRTLNAVQHNS